MTKTQITARYGRFPIILASAVLMRQLRQCDTHDQGDAILEMAACQIAQTRHLGKPLATAAEVAWAAEICPDGYYPTHRSPTLLTLLGPCTLGDDWDGIYRA